MATVHLIDASPYIFRAYFSLPESIRTPDGRPANAVRGFGSTLLQLFQQESVSHAAIAFDESLTSNFRNEIYPGYKANREPAPAELTAQFDDCRSLARALGSAVFSHERYEADDLIATLWAQLQARGHRVVVVSPDKDLCQLVNEGTALLDFAKNKFYGPEEVREKLGVPPERVLDYQALAGDAVDAIPGVKGIGAKTAAALMTAFASLEEIREPRGDLRAARRGRRPANAGSRLRGAQARGGTRRRLPLAPTGRPRHRCAGLGGLGGPGLRRRRRLGAATGARTTGPRGPVGPGAHSGLSRMRRPPGGNLRP